METLQYRPSHLKEYILDSSNILRNAVDHGIESPDRRTAAGKPRFGKIRIECAEDPEGIRIRISDDGRGIEDESILRVALEKGLIRKDQVPGMSEEDRVNLIFLPDLSTRETISEVSGRGIGMDAVRASLSRIGGTIRVISRPGAEAEFLLRLRNHV